MTQTIELVALLVILLGITFEAGFNLGRRAAAVQLASAFKKLPIRAEIRDAIRDAMRAL